MVLAVRMALIREKINERRGAPPVTASPPADSSAGGKMRWTADVPRWVKVFVITALGLALLVVLAMLLSGGRHGPGRHLSSAGIDATVAIAPQPPVSSAQTTRRL